MQKDIFSEINLHTKCFSYDVQPTILNLNPKHIFVEKLSIQRANDKEELKL